MKIVLTLGALGLLTACAPARSSRDVAGTGDRAPFRPPVIGLANPASVACSERFGGELSIVDRPGGQVGVCTLKDGRACEEWALFRDGRCVPA